MAELKKWLNKNSFLYEYIQKTEHCDNRERKQSYDVLSCTDLLPQVLAYSSNKFSGSICGVFEINNTRIVVIINAPTSRTIMP
jgi:hypothetical protein